jgi:hypothetical protein
LSTRKPGEGRQRSSACGQMQKSSTGKSHGVTSEPQPAGIDRSGDAGRMMVYRDPAVRSSPGD